MLKPMMVFGVLYSDLVGPSVKDMETGESQSIGESVMAHDEFFVRSCSCGVGDTFSDRHI